MRDILTRARAFEESENVGRNPTDNPTIGDVIATRLGRRDLLKGALGVAAIAATVSPLALAAASRANADTAARFRFEEIEAGIDANHHVAAGYDADVLIRWGDPVVAGAPAFDPKQQTRRRAAPAVRLQLRLHRLFPDAGRRQSVASRPPRRQPRIHQRGADVPRPAAAGRQERDVRRHDGGARRHRNGRAWRRGDRDPPRERQMAGRRAIRNTRRRIDADDADGHHRPGRGPCAAADLRRSERPPRARHGQQLRRRRDAVGHLADLRGELPRLLQRQARRRRIPRRATTSATACPPNGTPGASSTTASTSPRSRTSPTASAGSSRSIRSIRPRRRRSAPRSAASSTKAPPASSTRTAATSSIPATTSASTTSIASSPRRASIAPTARPIATCSTTACSRSRATTPTARSTGCRWCTGRGR